MSEFGSKKRVLVKRVYAAKEESDGYRVLVDRLWPRGLTKEGAKVDLWLKDVAPSADLRRWYNHQAERWPHFLRRYRIELKASADSRDAFSQLKRIVSVENNVTLLFGARDITMNNAVALQTFLYENASS